MNIDTTKLLTTNEAAEILGVNPSTVCAWTREKLLFTVPGPNRRRNWYTPSQILSMKERLPEKRGRKSHSPRPRMSSNYPVPESEPNEPYQEEIVLILDETKIRKIVREELQDLLLNFAVLLDGN